MVARGGEGFVEAGEGPAGDRCRPGPEERARDQGAVVPVVGAELPADVVVPEPEELPVSVGWLVVGVMSTLTIGSTTGMVTVRSLGAGSTGLGTVGLMPSEVSLMVRLL